jgi:hypothetical protein
MLRWEREREKGRRGGGRKEGDRMEAEEVMRRKSSML